MTTPGAAASAAEPPKPPAPKGEGEEKADDDESEGKGLVPIHNGAVYENYSWTQSLQDLQVTVAVPAGTKAKLLTVDIKKKALKVQVKGADAKLDGELFQSVKLEDSLCADVKCRCMPFHVADLLFVCCADAHSLVT